MKRKQLLGLLLALTLLLPVLLPAPAGNAEGYYGVVTITHSFPVNLRSGGSASYPIIATGQPGDNFTCTGIADTGWYQILLTDGRTAYVSPLLSALSGSVTPTPTPTPAASYKMVPVYYRSDLGTLLYTDSAYCAPGMNYVYANDARVPAGYTLTSARNIAVTLYSTGMSYPSFVTFTYTRASATATPSVFARVPVYYRSIYGSLLYTAYLDLLPGTRVVYANDALVPAGYVLNGSRTAIVTVSSSGTVSPSSVTFTYSPAVTAAPTATPYVSVSVPVYYRSSGGTLLFATYVACGRGTNTIYANDAYAPAGYTLIGSRIVYVTVSSSGVASPASVTYTYAPASTPAPTATPYLSVTVPVYYRSSGGSLLFATSIACGRGTNTVYANDAYAPAGYALVGSRVVYVTVSSSGAASPASVTFTYSAPLPPATATPEPVPVTVGVPVNYVDEASVVFYSDTVYCFTGNNSVVSDLAKVPEGYTLIGSPSVNVFVNAQGNAIPSSVLFTFSSSGSVIPTPTIDVLPEYQKFHMSGTYPVYSGPDESFFRANDSKAMVSVGGCRAYGAEGEWALIGYGLSSGDYRIGYVKRTSLPVELVLQELIFSNRPATIIKKATLTDDPIVNSKALYYLDVGTPVTYLAMLDNTRRWAYIELFNEKLGVMVRGFVSTKNLEISE